MPRDKILHRFIRNALIFVAVLLGTLGGMWAIDEWPRILAALNGLRR